MASEGRVAAYIGVGSNLDDPHLQVKRAFVALADLPKTHLVRTSGLYRSAPMGPQDQPSYINAVAALETTLSAEHLLDALQAIELAQGRVRNVKWGPRTLDLDLLVYGDEQICTERLQVPHPGLPQRHFVLYPLAELAASLEVPGMGRVETLLQGVSDEGIERLDGEAD